MFEPLSLTQCVAHVQSPFELRFQDGTALTLTLAEVADLGSTSQQEQFALRFLTTHYLPQQTYVLSHAVLGERALFLVPVAREGDLYRVEAVFNRLLES
jgi:hypothetical protein